MDSLPYELSTLHNGLRIITIPDVNVSTIVLGIWVMAGTRNESAQNNGMAHFLEHMAFKGTHKRNALEIAIAADNVGADMNAYTSRETTCYYMRMLKEDMSLGVDILSDIVRNSIFESEEIAREYGVISQEIGQYYDSPGEHVFDIFQECAFKDQPMGAPILGRKDILAHFKSDDFKDFIKQQYDPKKMIFCCAGNIDHQEFYDLVADEFADAVAIDDIAIVKAKYTGGYISDSRESEQLHLMLGFEAASYQQRQQRIHQALLSEMLGGGMSSRLFQEIREKRGLVYSIYCFNDVFSDSGLFAIYAGTGEEQVPELTKTLTHELKNYAQSANNDELKRAKAQYKAAMLMKLEQLSARCEYAARHALYYGDVTATSDIISMIESTNIDDIAQAAHNVFTSPPTIAAVGPTATLPDSDRFRDLLH